MNKELLQLPEGHRHPLSLEQGLTHIYEIGAEFQLDPFPTHFEVVPSHILYEFAAYTIPNRPHHWTHGRTYQILKSQYDHGLSRIYEMVVNSNPAFALLLENNPDTANILVCAHVSGHVDFFKHNFLFKQTDRDMPHLSSLRSDRIQIYESQHGSLQVERFLDDVLTLADHVDPQTPFRLSKEEQLTLWREELKKTPLPRPPLQIPFREDKDILGFLHDFSPDLEEWQRDILDIVRLESIYFYPQKRTKIMNEGWASLWHKNIMLELNRRNLISASQHEDWTDLHSPIVSPREQGLNPYWFGLVMWEYLIDYFNGNLTPNENNWLKDNRWPIYPRFEGPLRYSPAIPKIRDIMMTNDDQSFIFNYYNSISHNRMNNYLYDTHDMGDKDLIYVSTTQWQDVREYLINSLTNCGDPYLVVTDANYNDNGQLLIEHRFDGTYLDIDYLEKTLPYLYKLWAPISQRDVHIKTMLPGRNGPEEVIYGYDGDDVYYD